MMDALTINPGIRNEQILAVLTTYPNLFWYCFAIMICGLLSCTSPEVRFSQQAEIYGFAKTTVQSISFQHVIYSKPSINKQQATLHIYLDGDGSPWINHRWVSSDPTPRNTLMLSLMQLDENTSVYIGRPCYLGFSQSQGCTAELWTSHRYSPVVINAMASAIDKMIRLYTPERIILIGFSGGGALAMLVAEQLPQINGIITIAANLDINSWANYHGYLPLTGSLNPADRLPLAKSIFQLHLAGGRDNNVPVKQIKSFANRQYVAKLRIYDDYNHHCCWEEIWPSILTSINNYD